VFSSGLCEESDELRVSWKMGIFLNILANIRDSVPWSYIDNQWLGRKVGRSYLSQYSIALVQVSWLGPSAPIIFRIISERIKPLILGRAP
jgi:hypothetical protein